MRFKADIKHAEANKKTTPARKSAELKHYSYVKTTHSEANGTTIRTGQLQDQSSRLHSRKDAIEAIEAISKSTTVNLHQLLSRARSNV